MEKRIDTQNGITQPSLIQKIQGLIGHASQELFLKALSLYFCFQDSETPAWAKSVILSALGYFITPLDGIPDFTPLAGYSDDIGILIAATAVVTLHIKEEHGEEANKLLEKLFSKAS